MALDARAMKRDRWLMTVIIQQATIDKKRKKCLITIERLDMKTARTFSSSLHFIA
jgi:hypothetical protein